MEQDWKEKFKAEILEDMKKEAKQEIAEEMARVFVQLEEDKYNDEWISEKYGVPIYKVEQFREEHKKWEFAKKLEITEEPAYLEDNLISMCLLEDMNLKKGRLDGVENMLLLGLHAIGLHQFLKIISDDTKESLRTMLNGQDSYQMLSNLHVINNKNTIEQTNFWKQEVYSSTEFSEACLSANLLLKEGLCKKVDNVKEEF